MQRRKNKMTEQKKQTINIDGEDYLVEDLSDLQKYMITQVVDLKKRISNVRMQLDQFKVAQAEFSKSLSQSVKTKPQGENNEKT